MSANFLRQNKIFKSNSIKQRSIDSSQRTIPFQPVVLYFLFCKPTCIETSVLNVNNNSFLNALIVERNGLRKLVIRPPNLYLELKSIFKPQRCLLPYYYYYYYYYYYLISFNSFYWTSLWAKQHSSSKSAFDWPHGNKNRKKKLKKSLFPQVAPASKYERRRSSIGIVA